MSESRQFVVNEVTKKDDQREGRWTEVMVTETITGTSHRLIIQGWPKYQFALEESIAEELKALSSRLDDEETFPAVVGMTFVVKRER